MKTAVVEADFSGEGFSLEVSSNATLRAIHSVEFRCVLQIVRSMTWARCRFEFIVVHRSSATVDYAGPTVLPPSTSDRYIAPTPVASCIAAAPIVPHLFQSLSTMLQRLFGAPVLHSVLRSSVVACVSPVSTSPWR